MHNIFYSKIKSVIEFGMDIIPCKCTQIKFYNILNGNPQKSITIGALYIDMM